MKGWPAPAPHSHTPVFWSDLILASVLSLPFPQRRLFEKKQRRKRQEPLMVQANPDASLRHRRGRRREERLPGDRGEENARPGSTLPSICGKSANGSSGAGPSGLKGRGPSGLEAGGWGS